MSGLPAFQAYRLSRQSRFEDFYDVGDGDWGWITTNIDEDGEQFVNLALPETPDDFYFHVFSMSKGLHKCDAHMMLISCEKKNCFLLFCLAPYPYMLLD